jgi:anthranilate phosphoribosyltransferase
MSALSVPELEAGFAAMMDGEAGESDIRAFLLNTIPHMTDPVALAAGAKAMRARMIPVAAPDDAIDVCGTGGDGAHTLNISTAVAFVVAGCGVTVAKHGNRAMSSKSGAADVLEALGVTLTGDASALERCLREARVAFLFAQNHHPAMRHVAPVRRALGQRTIFNLLGPLSNPASVKRQLVGVYSVDAVTPMAEALSLLGATRAIVVHGAGGLDELSCEGPAQVAEVVDGAVRRTMLSPADAGLPSSPNAGVRGGDAQENAVQLRRLLQGNLPGSGYESFVVLNAAAALLAAGQVDDLHAGADRARSALNDGSAFKALVTLCDLTADAR